MIRFAVMNTKHICGKIFRRINESRIQLRFNFAGCESINIFLILPEFNQNIKKFLVKK